MDAPFTLLGIYTISSSLLKRYLLRQLWNDILGMRPLVNELKAFVDDGTLFLGTGPTGMNVLLPPQELKGQIELWVENLPAAKIWYAARGFTLTTIDATYPKEHLTGSSIQPELTIYLLEAPKHIASAFRDAAR
jgi:hypothetical protein